MFSTARRGPRAGSWIRERLASTWLLGPAIALLTWPLQEFNRIKGGDDGSWVIGLHKAVHEGLHFGSQVNWSYGPLGFLTVPKLSYPLLGWLSLGYAAVVWTALAVSVLWAARRSLPLLLAVPVAAVVCLVLPLTGSDDRFSVAVLGIAFIWCVAVLNEREEKVAAARWLFPLAAGAVSGLEVLTRLNSGVTVVLMCALTTAVAFPHARRRAVGYFAGAFCASILTLWLGSGQALSDLPNYVANSFELISGFSQAMGQEQSPAWEYIAAAGATAVAFAAALVVRVGERCADGVAERRRIAGFGSADAVRQPGFFHDASSRTA